jgi:hypothetical protein
MPTHAQWMFYLVLDRSFQLSMHNDHSHACAVDVLPGLEPEFPNANVGQVAFISHAQACSVDVLSGFGPAFPNANVGQYASLSHAHAFAVELLPGLGPEFPNAITHTK